VLDDYFEKEHQLQASDRLQEECAFCKNALESYVYSLRNRMYETLAPYIADADKASLGDTLQATEDWLYDEGDDTSKSVYVAKLDDLKKVSKMRQPPASARSGLPPACCRLPACLPWPAACLLPACLPSA
jgi:heat shock protein 4